MDYIVPILMIAGFLAGCLYLGKKRLRQKNTEGFMWVIKACTNWALFKANNFHKHAIALPVTAILTVLSKNLFPSWWAQLICSFIIYWGLIWIFEILQGIWSNETEKPKSSLSRLMDVQFTTMCAWTGVVIGILINNF